MNLLFGREWDGPPPDRMCPVDGKIVLLTDHGKPANKAVVNGEERSVPAEIHLGDIFNLPFGEIAIVQT